MVLDARLLRLAPGLTSSSAAGAPTRTAVSTEPHATLEAMFLMAAVDGEVAPEELELLGQNARELLGDAAMESGAMDQALERCNEALGREGWTQRVEAVAASLGSHEAKARAFRLAAGVALVDDYVAHAEAAGIDALGAALGLSAEESQQILREVQHALFDED